jgi:hypothetical protein
MVEILTNTFARHSHLIDKCHNFPERVTRIIINCGGGQHGLHIIRGSVNIHRSVDIFVVILNVFSVTPAAPPIIIIVIGILTGGGLTLSFSCPDGWSSQGLNEVVHSMVHRMVNAQDLNLLRVQALLLQVKHLAYCMHCDVIHTDPITNHSTNLNTEIRYCHTVSSRQIVHTFVSRPNL